MQALSSSTPVKLYGKLYHAILCPFHFMHLCFVHLDSRRIYICFIYSIFLLADENKPLVTMYAMEMEMFQFL